MWIKPIQLEFSEHELRTLRDAIGKELTMHKQSLATFTPTTAIYACTKLMCDELTSLQVKLNHALGGVQ